MNEFILQAGILLQQVLHFLFIQFHRFEINRRQFHDVPGERPGARPYFQQPFEPLFLQHGHDLADDILIPQEMLPQ